MGATSPVAVAGGGVYWLVFLFGGFLMNLFGFGVVLLIRLLLRLISDRCC